MTRTAGRRAAQLSGFEVQAELGRGAFTTVHQVRHGGHRYALKRPTAETADDPTLLSSFQREAALLACVDDPAVARIHAAGLLDGVPALVLEHLGGGSLADQLGAGPLGQEQTVELGAQLARGLAAAHRVGLVHRDVKPGNIMVSPGQPAKLIDFGLALLGDGGEPGADDRAVGTFLYSSPEQSGMLKRAVDGRSDLYSLGVVLFECLTGRLPFEAADVGELLRLHLVAPVPDLHELRAGIDPALVAVIGRLLAKDPDDRYPDAAAVLADLRACPGGEAAEEPAVVRWPLCGREVQSEQLAARWSRACAGHGGVVLIRGAAGSGHTRLAEEAVMPGVPLLWAAGEPDDALPLAALREAIDGYLQTVRWLPGPERAAAVDNLREAAAVSGPALVARLSPRLAETIGAGADGEGHQDAVLAATSAFLGDLARRSGGLIVVVDDAQWLDPGTREVLSRLSPDLPGLPLLVVIAERDGEPGAGLTADLELTCEPLEPAAVHALIASRLPGATVTPELAGHVADRTGGSPFAVVAYLWRLIDAGLISPLWGTWWFDEAGATALPAADDVRELLASRLTALPSDVREVLAAAAVVGTRFRTETLTAAGLAADAVIAAVALAVDRRVLESRAGGWYAFIHPLLREELLAGMPCDRQRRLHAAIVAGLESLPEALRDADHVYAVARHHSRAGDEVPAEQRRRSAFAAGLSALDDQAPAEALGYLRDAIEDDPAPPTAVLHPLALAYLRNGRIEEALDAIRRALAGEPDRRTRARLLTTEIEIHHTVWQDGRALAAAAKALGELRRPLPRNPLLLLVVSVCAALAGAFVRRTGWGFGTATGRRREDLAALAAALDAGGYSAAIGLRLRETMLLGMRAMYSVNRLGPGTEYVRVYALVGYVATVARLRGVGGRCLDRAARTAADLNEPGLTAYVEWMRGCGKLFGGLDDGASWVETMARNSRWYGPAQLLPGYTTIGLRRLFRGYVQDAREEYERGLAVMADLQNAQGTSFSMLPVMIPAIQGRPGEAATALAALRVACPPQTATRGQRAHIVVAAACAAVEEGEFGDRFDSIVDEFRSLGLRNRDLMQQHKWFFAFQSHGRMAQLRLATDEQRPARLAAAKAAVADLRRVRRSSPLLDCAYLIGEAALAQLGGDPKKAVEWTDRAERVARRVDSPITHFEVARFRARAFRQLGLAAESDRQARWALALASQYGWELRRRQVRTEFGVEEGSGRTVRRTVVGRRSDGGRNRRLEALQQVGAAAADVLEPGQLARVTLDEMLRILGAERALFFLLDEAGEPVHYAGRGADGTDLTETTAYGATLVRRVADEGEPLVLTGTEQGAALGSRSAVAHGLRSILVVPVRFKGSTLGVVYLDSRMARGIFTEEDVEVLTGMSSHLAVSLETARAAQLHLAVQTARQQQAFAETLRASLAELSSIHDPAQLLRQLFATLSSQLGATAGGLLGADDAVVVDVSGDAPETLLGSTPSVDVPGVAPVLIDDPGLLGTDAVLAVPLHHREGRVGVVLLGGAAFDDTARKVAAALAFQGMAAYDNARLFSRVEELATTDELTGQHNRRHFYAIAGALVEAAGRSGRELAAVMLDIDKFKSINDTYGHGVGDEVIREVAARVRASIRQSDVLGRYGGEEFAVVLPDHEGAAPELAERMRSAVADTPVPTPAGPVPVTISVGLARLDPAASDDTLDQVLARADHALYRAKEAGRNRVVLS